MKSYTEIVLNTRDIIAK